MRRNVRTVIILAAFVVVNVWATDYYVAQNGQTPEFPYASPETAASNIQYAVNAVSVGAGSAQHTIWVGPGRYTAPTNATAYSDSNTNVVLIFDKAIILPTSSTNPVLTILDGGDKYRGVRSVCNRETTNRIVIDGFTVSNCFVNNSGGGQTLAKGSKLLPAEEDGWQLAFEDNFDREELGENWTVVDGKWKIQNGDLRGFGTLILAQEFPCGDTIGFQRLEFEAVTDVHPMIFFENKPKPTVVVGDMSSFIHAQPPEKGDPVLTGYFFQFGGLNNTKTQLLRGGEVVDLEENLDKMVTPDVVQRVVVENDMGTLRMFIDGVLIFEHKEQQSIMGQGHERIGFYFHTAAKVFDVKVYVKKLPSGLDIE